MAPIIEHADIRRSLMTMKALTQAARAICLVTGGETDVARRAKDAGRAAAAAAPRGAAHPDRQGLLHRHRLRGGLHRRAGARRHGLHRGDRRGAALSRRPHPADLRGHQRHPGHRPRRRASCRWRAARWSRATSPSWRRRPRRCAPPTGPSSGAWASGSREAVAALAEATRWMGGALRKSPDAALAGAAPYLRLFGLAAGGIYLAKGALASARNGAGGGQGDGQGDGGAMARATARPIAHPCLPASLPRRWPRPRRGSRTRSSMAPPPLAARPRRALTRTTRAKPAGEGSLWRRAPGPLPLPPWPSKARHRGGGAHRSRPGRSTLCCPG